jgi:imidazolonepropionase-like amidohydrolase
LLQEIVRRAHASGRRVMTHVETAGDFHNSLVAGVDEIGHTPGFRGNEKTQIPSFAPYLITDADAELAARKSIPVVTTLGGIATVPRDGPDSVLRRRFDSLATMNLAMLKKHHVAIAIGSDSYRTTSLPEALYLNSLGVLTNAELLRAWTEMTARAIFPTRRIGRLMPGYEASFLVLDGNPLDDFANVQRIRLRFKQGTVIHVPTQ